MRYIILGLLVMLFTACGSSSSSSEENVTTEVDKPIVPTPKDATKQPPSIPNI